MRVMDDRSNPRLLLVEDDRQLGPLLVALLEDQFSPVLVSDGQRGLHLALTETWDVMVIDRGLPILDGVHLITAVRTAGILTPILILTARGAVSDKVDGLDAGANDYLVKPFDAVELAARLRALTRTYPAADRSLRAGAWDFDPVSRLAVHFYGERMTLSPRESELLVLLAREPNRVLSRPEILANVFDTADGLGIVDTYVHYLRRKLGRSIVRTVHGTGYQLGESE